MPLGLALTDAALRVTSRQRSAVAPVHPPSEVFVLVTEAGEPLVTELGERLAVEPEP